MFGLHRTARTIAAGAAALFCLTAPALADEPREFEWSFTVAGTSDYIFRGISLSGEDPALQASINMSYGIFYAGLWSSNVDGAGYAPVEVDAYMGIKPVLGPVTFDFGVVYYTYPGGDPGGTFGLDYVEFKAGASGSPFKNFTVSPTFWYTPDQSNYVETYTIESTFAYELAAVGIFTPTISALVGYTEGDGGSGIFLGEDDYTYWNAGLALSVEKFVFDFRYWDTTLANGGGGLADERFVFTASITLP